MSSKDVVHSGHPDPSGQSSNKVKVKLTDMDSIITYNPKHAISIDPKKINKDVEKVIGHFSHIAT